MAVVIEDVLVDVWRQSARGDEDGARERLGAIWKAMVDGAVEPRVGRVCHRLMDRLAVVTDDRERWAQMPERFLIFRTGPDGWAWSTDRDVVARLAEGDPIRSRTVGKEEVTAYFTGYGEDEVVLREAG
jgi:hypothetical protein